MAAMKTVQKVYDHVKELLPDEFKLNPELFDMGAQPGHINGSIDFLLHYNGESEAVATLKSHIQQKSYQINLAKAQAAVKQQQAESTYTFGFSGFKEPQTVPAGQHWAANLKAPNTPPDPLRPGFVLKMKAAGWTAEQLVLIKKRLLAQVVTCWLCGFKAPLKAGNNLIYRCSNEKDCDNEFTREWLQAHRAKWAKKSTMGGQSYKSFLSALQGGYETLLQSQPYEPVPYEPVELPTTVMEAVQDQQEAKNAVMEQLDQITLKHLKGTTDDIFNADPLLAHLKKKG